MVRAAPGSSPDRHRCWPRSRPSRRSSSVPRLIRRSRRLRQRRRCSARCVAEIGRGLDFFRSAVIEALGDHRAAYAVDADSAVAACRRRRFRTMRCWRSDASAIVARLRTLSSLSNPPPEVVAALQAAQCMLGDACAAAHRMAHETARSRGASAKPSARRWRRWVQSRQAGMMPRGRRSWPWRRPGPTRLTMKRRSPCRALRSGAARQMIAWLDRRRRASRATRHRAAAGGLREPRGRFRRGTVLRGGARRLLGGGGRIADATVLATLIDKLEF